jgi:hypothetical protein
MKATAIIIQLVFAAGVFALGRWGLRHAETLTPAELSEQDRQRRTQVARRGGIACQAAGVALALINLVVLF